MAVHFWLRAETRPFEGRTHLTPEKCRDLIAAGHKVTVEKSDQRIFKDEEYESIPGVQMVPLGSWTTAPNNAFILGLKDLPVKDDPISHHHVYFAHAYKNQSGCEQLLHRFHKGGGCIFDIEFMMDENGKAPVAAEFSVVAGSVGMALGISAWCYQKLEENMSTVSPHESEQHLINQVKSLLKRVAEKKGVSEAYPTILVVGALGQCGRGSLDMARKIGIPETNLVKWDLEETKKGGPFKEILDVDIFVNCIYLSKKIPPFLTLELLNTDDRKLTQVVDVSCDVHSPDNPLPIYNAATTPTNPVRSIAPSGAKKPLDVLAIDILPSILPREASQRLANKVTPYLKTLGTANPDPLWTRAKEMFNKKIQEVCQGTQ